MSWRRIVLPAVVGVLAAGLSWLVGVVTVDAILVGGLLAAIVGTPRWLGYPAARDWPGHPDEGGQRGYHEVRRLADMIGRESGGDAFDRLIAPRLRELSERRLAAANVSLDDDAVREILGADVVDWLNGRPGRLDTRPRVKQAELVLDRLDEYFDVYTESGKKV